MKLSNKLQSMSEQFDGYDDITLHLSTFEFFIKHILLVSDKSDLALRSAYKALLLLYEHEDSENNLIIIPEIWPDVLDGYKNVQKSIWWLSVANALGTDQRDFHLKLTQSEYLGVHHFYQSQYAYWFLLNHGAQYVYPLFDYINRDYITDITHENRDNVVLYNPKKGIEITKQLMDENPDIEFIPLINMNRDQLRELMLKSKLYIDFGHHPGKDKFPREAATCGCALITSFNGSARFFQDVMIDPQYKFDDTVEGVSELIKDIFNNFETHFNNFNLYRKVIKAEVETFNNQVKNSCTII
jgi:hypothetical protein